MNSMPRDAEYIASRLKYIRQMARLTQENVADACGLTVRTIQKIESGRHIPDEQTIISIARGLKLDPAYFDKPSPEEELKLRADFERALRKIAVVPTEPIKSVKDFLVTRWNRHAYRIDYSAIENDEALIVATGMADYMRDVGELWDELYDSQKVEFGESFLKYTKDLASHGYVLYFGAHRQRRKDANGPLTFSVGVISFQKSDGKDQTRYAIIDLEGRWEIPEEDRAKLPDDGKVL